MNILVAVLYSFLAPGSGQAYNGQKKKSFLFAMIAIVTSGVIQILNDLPAPETVRIALMGLIWVVVGVAVTDAYIDASRNQKNGLRPETANWRMAIVVYLAVTACRLLIKDRAWTYLGFGDLGD